MPKKETIKAPTKKELTDASKELKKGHSSGGRVLADKSVAVRQGAAKPAKKSKSNEDNGTSSGGPRRGKK
jgi:hypothetical protein